MFFFLHHSFAGDDYIFVDENFTNTRIKKYTDFYVGNTTIESVDDLIKVDESDWRRVSEKGISLPYKNLTYWYRFKIVSHQTGQYYLENPYTYLPCFHLFILNKNELIDYGNAGFGNADYFQKTNYYVPTFELNFNEDDTLIGYLKLKKKFSTSSLPITLWKGKEYHQNANKHWFVNGVISGVFYILLFIGLIAYFYFKDTTYLYYFLYVLSLLIVLVINNGSGKIIYGHHYFINGFGVYLPIVTTLFFMFLLCFRVFQIKRSYPIFYKGILFSFIVMFLVYFWSAYAYMFLPNYPLFLFKVSNSLLIIFPVSLFYICIKVYLKTKNKSAIWFLLIFALTLIFIVFFSLLPYFTYSLEAFYAFKWLILFEALAVLLVLFDDLFKSKKTKEILQEELLIKQKEAVDNILIGQSKERNKISSYLHDIFTVRLGTMKKIVSEQLKNTSINEDINSKLDELLLEVREFSHFLNPTMNNDKTLEEAINEEIFKLEDAYPNIVILFSNELKQTLPIQKKELFFFTVSELLNNSIKHSKFNQIEITLFEDEKYFILNYKDNGQGIDVENTGFGYGLSSIQSRADLMKGHFDVFNEDGLFISFKIPH